jgi:hypothetical protein
MGRSEKKGQKDKYDFHLAKDRLMHKQYQYSPLYALTSQPAGLYLKRQQDSNDPV